MRICLLTRYFDYRNAGIGRVSCEIRDRLIERGHDVVSVSTNKESLISYFTYTALGIRTRIPKDCDVYHAITPMEGMWLPQDKSVVTYLDLIPMTHPERSGAGMGQSWLKNAIGSRYFAYAAKRSSEARIVTAISDMTSVYVRNLLGTRGVEVIRLGIRGDLEPTPKNHSPFRVGYLGQLDRRKRVDLLIHEYSVSKIDGELLIAGTGRDEGMLRELAKGDTRIKFVGFVPDKDLAAFYNQLDVFAFPSWIEGYGLPIVEAFACKKPVIVWPDSTIPWELKERCHLFTGVFPVSQSSQEREDNYQFAKLHSWDKCADLYEEIYRRIAG